MKAIYTRAEYVEMLEKAQTESKKALDAKLEAEKIAKSLETEVTLLREQVRELLEQRNALNECLMNHTKFKY